MKLKRVQLEPLLVNASNWNQGAQPSKELISSIKEYGILHPVELAGGHLVHGRRRVLATAKLRRRTILAVELLNDSR
jgi:ParB-like chromosome segregation protein Spo0J